MFALLTSALVAMPPLAVTSPDISLAPDIVIIGQRIDDAKARLAACLARHCPAKEDIDATLGLAEAELVNGDYDEARETLQASIRRNRTVGPEYALPLSDLYRANGRVAAHLGIDSDYYRSAYAAYDAVKRGTDLDDYRRFMARIDIAEMLGETRNHDWARNYYDGIARDARKAGRPDIAALAELRSLIRHYPEGEMRTRGIQRIAALSDPAFRAAALEAKLALGRVAFEKNDPAAARAIMSDLAAMRIDRPILIYAPPFELTQRELPNGDFFDVNLAGAGPGVGPAITRNLPTARWSTTNRLAEKVDDMWIDVGFRIATDGSVKDVKILRSRGERYWTKPLLASIRGRRYTPAVEGSPESYRKERYTYTAAWQKQSGSKMVARSPQARIEYLDLSPSGLSRQN
jgi:tetratricopeptide (TPR) repeat protein